MSTADPVPTEEDNVSILSFDDLEDDALHGSDIRIQRWLSQQCRFGLDVPKGEKELRMNVSELCGAGELLPTVLMKKHRRSSTVSEEVGEAALRADSPLLGFGIEDEKTLMDPLHFPSATYVRDLPESYRKHSPHSSYSSSAAKRTLGLSRRPSLLRQPSLPLLDEQAVTQVISLSTIPPQPSRSRAQSNASISSFHLPTSMQVSIPPLTPTSPPSRRHSKIPNSPSLSSTLASFSFGGNDTAGPLPSPIPRPHSQLHHGHRHPPPTQKMPHTLSRSSSTLSLLTHSRNAIYIDDPIDIDSGVDPDDLGFGVDSVVEDGEDDRLQVRNENHGPLKSHTNTSHIDGVYFNVVASSSQVYVGLGTNTKTPTRPPPAPPLIMDGDDKGGLGGVGVVDEDAILNAGDDANEGRHRVLDGDRSGGGVYLDHHHSHRQQQIQFEESDVIHHTDVNLRDEVDEPGDDKPFMSRWSLASSIDETPTSAGGGLFKSIKRMSLGGDKDKIVYRENKEKEVIDKEKGIDREKEKKEREKSTDKKRGRLISFISRISSNIASSPPSTPITRSSSPSAATSTNDGYEHESPIVGFWFGDMMLPPSPVLPSTLNAGGGSGEKKGKDGKNQKSKEKGSDKFREKVKETALRQLPTIVPNSSTSSPRLSPLPSPSTYSTNGSSNGLKGLSPIAKALSTGFQDAGSALDFMGVRSGSALGSMDGEMGGSAMRTRSSSVGDLLGRRAGDRGQYDLYQQQAFGQQGRQGLVQGLGQEHGQGRGQSPSQAKKHASAYLHPQLRLQLGEGYPPETGYHQVHRHPYEQQQHRERRQSQQLQSQFGLQQQQRQQSQLYSSVSDTFYNPAGTLPLRSPASIDTATATGFDAAIPRRPGLVKSASTPMLNIDGGRGVRYGNRYGNAFGNDATIARRYAALPATPVSFTTTDEEEDYGIEANGRWRDDTLEYGSERERAMTTRETDKKLEKEHSIITTTNNATFTTPIATPKASIEMPMSPSSSIGHDITASRRNSNIIVTNAQKQMQSVVRGVDKRNGSTLGNPPIVRNEATSTTAGVTLTTTLTIKSTSSLSKGFRGFVERMKFTTTNSSVSSMPSPPLIPPMVPTNIIPSTSSSSLFTTTTTTSTTSSISPSTSHSSANSIAVESSNPGGSTGGVMGLPDGSFLTDRLLGSDKKQPKRKLVINGVSEEDVKGYEAVKAWCESFGEVKEMRRTPDGYLHVDFRKASVAETVCRLKTQVFIKGAGSVSLSWYTMENKG